MISSPRNERVRELRRLHRTRGRREAGRTLLEGPKLLDAARRAGAPILEVWAGDGSGDVTCSDAVIAAISTTDTPQSPVAVMVIPEPGSLRPVDTLVLWDIADPGNAGAMIRTAAALGWDVAYTAATTDVWSPKALRAGAGGHFATTLAPIEGVEELTGHVAVAAVARGGGLPGAVPTGPRALLVGSEARGLPVSATSAAITVTLPLAAGVESLNAGVAAAILMWELRHRSP